MSPSTDRRDDPGLGPHEQGERITAGTDLAARWLGASVLVASDESFGDKENLLNPDPANFEPGHFGNRGEIVDGWETRRRRDPGYDWALVRLGTPGRITSVDVDTSFFTGNYPETCRIEACGCEGYPSPERLNDPDTDWLEIVPRVPLHGGVHNTFPVTDPHRFTHLRLSIFPDGGIARLRVFGIVVPDPRVVDGVTIDLVSQEYGGTLIASSDGFFSSAHTLNRPDRARTMGEGWETRRRRDSGHDFAVFKLGFAGQVNQLIVDTSHFKYNASAAVAVYGCSEEPVPSVDSPAWVPLLERVSLQPDTPHVFMVASQHHTGSVRFDAFPDGGLSRVRVIGHIDPSARRAAGYQWFNALPPSQALQCLTDAGVAEQFAIEVVARRPRLDDWLAEREIPQTPLPSDPSSNADLRAIRRMLEGPQEVARS